MNPALDAVVIENGLRSMATEGLAYDRCRVGVVTGLDAAVTLPELDLETPDDLRKVLRTQIDVVLPTGIGVLAAGDPVVAEMAALCDGEVIFFDTAPANAIPATRSSPKWRRCAMAK